MLQLRDWLAIDEVRNARPLFNDVLYPSLFRVSKYQKRILLNNRVNFLRSSDYLTIQPTLRNIL